MIELLRDVELVDRLLDVDVVLGPVAFYDFQGDFPPFLSSDTSKIVLPAPLPSGRTTRYSMDDSFGSVADFGIGMDPASRTTPGVVAMNRIVLTHPIGHVG